MNPFDVRQLINNRLRIDLLGPHSEEEVLLREKIRPSDLYLTGILWPKDQRMGAEDDDGGICEESEDGPTTQISPLGQTRPCSCGLSFAVEVTDSELVSVEVRFGTYKHEIEIVEGRSLNKWTRTPWVFYKEILLSPTLGEYLDLESCDLGAKVQLFYKVFAQNDRRYVTLNLINSSEGGDGRNEAESKTLFQSKIQVTANSSVRLIPRVRPLSDCELESLPEDVRVNYFLYRDIKEFATGHQCSATWERLEAEAPRWVSTEWLPTQSVPSYKQEGSSHFSELISSGVLSAEFLAYEDDSSLIDGLNLLCNSYRRWIKDQLSRLNSVTGAERKIGIKNIIVCRRVLARMRASVHALVKDKSMREAFRLANATMALQHGWKKTPAGDSMDGLTWRPFQLAFFVLASNSACNPKSDDREILDLLWFPTGGGKTEAYLAIISMVAWFRRLHNLSADDGAGNSAIMRYTLRLLTAQQFERASSMILASELIRKGLAKPRLGMGQIGKIPFSIGLWVGKDATPNNFKSAMESRGGYGSSSAEQLDKCPCCGFKVKWKYDEVREQVNPFCDGVNCELSGDFGLWPVFTVDTDIYKFKPTLLIGTVDKFAQLPLNENLSDLFGVNRDNVTDLIVQDELHLISGPLGTVAGLYETAIDWLLRKGDRRPKVVGSTATIRRADEQVRALFDREACQFPSPGITYADSGFAVVDFDAQNKWRQYVGVTTAGRSAKFSLQAVAGSLLQSGGEACNAPDHIRDGYSTLLCYFNSLRELGGAIVQMLDDVPDSIKLYKEMHQDSFARELNIPEELTSRVSQREILDILTRLKKAPPDPDVVDVVLATNMVSVGVDVPRLGMMLVNGQPKTRSEYIQSTSRVGRSNFPGLVVSLLNAAKPRDRSHYETFESWHGTIYKDVEATSVTPFAPRSCDRALKAIVISMIRHSHPDMLTNPDLIKAPTELIKSIVSEIERRVTAIDPQELSNVQKALDILLEEWSEKAPKRYSFFKFKPRDSALMQSAEDHARRVAIGRDPGTAWPILNTMRSVEPSSRFRLVERLQDSTNTFDSRNKQSGDEALSGTVKPRWRS